MAINPEKFEAKIEYKPGEKEESILEKEPLLSENFDIYYDKGIKEILENGDEARFDKIKEFIEKTLGMGWKIESEKLKIYLFSGEEDKCAENKEYTEFLRENFPNIAPEFATFDKKSKKSVFKYERLPKGEISEKDRIIARSDIFSGVGHELAHLHPFYNGIGNEGSENKWEQEMVCIFIGEKIRTGFGGQRFREYQFQQAQKYLKELSEQKRKFSWEDRGQDWENFTDAERFVYPWLEKKYGLGKLQNLWKEMFKKKKSITEAIEKVYGRKITELEKNFEQDVFRAGKYLEVET